VLDYVEGWFDGNADAWSGRAPHPELVKRCRGLEGDEPDTLETLSAREMIDATAEGIGSAEDAEDRHLPGATCICHRYVDLLDLLRMPGDWRIVDAAWELR
jgi:hypothetical protein